MGMVHMDSVSNSDDPAVWYIVATTMIEVQALWYCCMQIASFAWFFVGRESLTLESKERRVGSDLNTALMWKSLHTLQILSPMPASRWPLLLPSPCPSKVYQGAEAELMKERG